MQEAKITPWDADAGTTDNVPNAINYDHVISQFGCQKFTRENCLEFERLVPGSSSLFFRRGLIFAHRDFDRVVECIKSKEPFYLYTGRGASSKSMHLGHALPFLVCKMLQDAFKCPLVVQMTDDEKYLCKDQSFEQIRSQTMENIRDIIAFGFDPSLTYIFTNCRSSHLFIENILKVSKLINLNEAMKTFGFGPDTNIGMVSFPAKEIAAAYSSSFSFLGKKMQCLIPCAVDQDPFFRLARDKAFTMGEKKPSTVYLQLLPDLQGVNRKMSASDPKSSIYLDDRPEAIKAKINKYAFSGGQETLELHREKGGRTDIDVAYQYLRYFLEDDLELERLRKGYEMGEVTSGELKKKCIAVVQSFISEYQGKRGLVDDALVERFMSTSKE